MQKSFNETNAKIDENTKVILDAVSNEIVIGDSNTKLNDLSTKTDAIVRKIETATGANSKLTQDEKYVDIAIRIGRDKNWDDKDNLVNMVDQVARCLSNRNFTGLGNQDLYTYAYSKCCDQVMFSGEAYDLAEPYATAVTAQFFRAFFTVMQCLNAVEAVSQFTDEQINALSKASRADYDSLHANQDQVNTQKQYFADLVFNVDSPDSVISHFYAFQCRKAYDRNVFVRKGTKNIVISPEVVVNDLSIGVTDGSGKEDIYYYSDYKDYVDGLSDKLKSAISNANNSSALSFSYINELFEYFIQKKTYGKSFDDFLAYVGIETKNFRNNKNTFFPVDGFQEKGTKLEHRADNYYKKWYYYAGFSSFDHYIPASETKDIESREIYRFNLKGWYVDHVFDANYSTTVHLYPVSMLLFQEGTRTEIPKTAAEIAKKLGKLTIKKGAFSYIPTYFSTERSAEYYESPYFDVSIQYDSKSYSQSDIMNSGLFPSGKWQYKKSGSDDKDIEELIRFSAPGKPGMYLFRLKVDTITGITLYSDWVEAQVGEKVPEDNAGTGERLKLFVGNCYTGLVGAPPDKIESSAEALPQETGQPSHQRLWVNVYDEENNKKDAGYIWEAQETEGISLTEDGTVAFTEPGTYHVRVKSGEYSSDWVEIAAVTESEEYSTVSFLDDDGSVIKNICLPWGTALEPPAVPERDGYTFAGWSPALPDRVPADDLSLTAVWVKAQAPADKDTDGKSRNPATGNSAAAAAAAAAIIGAVAAVRRRSPRKH